MTFERRVAGRLVRRQRDTVLNMITLSHSLDIPKTERSRYFSMADIIPAECSFFLTGKQQGSICHDEKVAYRPLIIG